MSWLHQSELHFFKKNSWTNSSLWAATFRVNHCDSSQCRVTHKWFTPTMGSISSSYRLTASLEGLAVYGDTKSSLNILFFFNHWSVHFYFLFLLSNARVQFFPPLSQNDNKMLLTLSLSYHAEYRREIVTVLHGSAEWKAKTPVGSLQHWW